MLQSGVMYCVALDYGTVSASSLEISRDNIDAIGNITSNEAVYTDEVMGEMLNSVAKTYFAQLDIYNFMAAGQSNVSAVRDLSVGIVGFGVNVVYTFNRPSELNESGIFLDIGHDVHSVVSYDNNTENEKLFMLQAGIYASAMEHGVLEQVTGVESVSTIKIFQYAEENNIPIHYVTKENISSELDMLEISDQVKKEISSAVNAGKTVIIPEQEVSVNQWSGVGYMVLDTETFACGYMISGGLAGGMMSAGEVLGEFAKSLLEALISIVDIMFKVALIYLVVAFVCPAALPVVILYGSKILVAAAYIFTILAGLNIGMHYYNYVKTNDVGEIQKALIELATLCTLVYAGEKVGEKLKSDSVAKAGEEAAEACKEGTCFVAGTLISTSTGSVPIENIKAGDVVYSFDEETQEVSEQVVEETFIRESNELVHIKVGDETITTTPEHPFYMPKKGFVNAINLRAGDTLWTINGEYVIIEKIQHEILESPVKVYNFRVAQNHTYFAGNAAVGVHNAAYPSNNYNWGNQSTLQDHFNRHGGDVGASSPADYARIANEFYNNRGNYQVKVDSQGVTRVYDPVNNIFGSYNPDGTTKTLFSPTRGQAYFDSQPGV